MAVEIISRLILALSILLILVVSPCFSQEASTPQSIPEKIAWSKHPGVTHYRLQIAGDRQFQDVLFDRLVEGFEYVVSDLLPGSYYWRVAPQFGSTDGLIELRGFHGDYLRSFRMASEVTTQPIVVCWSFRYDWISYLGK